MKKLSLALPLAAFLAVLAVGASAAQASGPARAAQKKKLLSPAPAPVGAGDSLSDEEVKNQLNALLGAIDTPIGAESFRALGRRGARLLLGIAKNGEEFPTRRAKAVDGLSQMRWTPAATLLRELAKDEAQPIVVRFSSVRGLGYLSSKTQVVRELTILLEQAKDPRVRAVAAEELSHRTTGGCAQLQKQLAREEADVRGMFGRAQANCDAQDKAKTSAR